jgi:hypothetical protein
MSEQNTNSGYVQVLSLESCRQQLPANGEAVCASVAKSCVYGNFWGGKYELGMLSGATLLI